METLKIIIIAIVQGFTEILPISSSGHILLLANIWDMDVTSAFLELFHLGTTIAIIVFSWNVLFKNLFTKKKLIFYAKIIVSSIPAAVLGFCFEDVIDNTLRAEWIMAGSLIFWGIIMIIVERKTDNREKENTDIENVSWKQSIIMGFAQSFALIPGTSRSGITTLGGIVSGLDKYTSLQYSLILGIPVLLGSFLWSCFKAFILNKPDVLSFVSVPTFIMIFLITFVIGLISLVVLKKVKKEKWLTIFGIYRILLGILILVLLY